MQLQFHGKYLVILFSNGIVALFDPNHEHSSFSESIVEYLQVWACKFRRLNQLTFDLVCAFIVYSFFCYDIVQRNLLLYLSSPANAPFHPHEE